MATYGKLRLGLILIKVCLIICLVILTIVPGFLSCSQQNTTKNDDARSIVKKYSSDFPFSQNPISEADNWINGAKDGKDWGNVATKKSLAYGLQNGAIHYSDGTALLKGSWWPNQETEATVYVDNTNKNDFPEVELRLRSSLSAHNCTGYEVLYGVAEDNPYFAIVRWNGALGDFTYLYDRNSPGYGSAKKYVIHDGAVVKATITGNLITAYINGVQVAQVTDNTFSAGNPGMGFNYYCGENCTGPQDGYGFTKFSATAKLKPAHKNIN